MIFTHLKNLWSSDPHMSLVLKFDSKEFSNFLVKKRTKMTIVLTHVFSLEMIRMSTSKHVIKIQFTQKLKYDLLIGDSSQQNQSSL